MIAFMIVGAMLVAGIAGTISATVRDGYRRERSRS
jgi:hypothetical protein